MTYQIVYLDTVSASADALAVVQEGCDDLRVNGFNPSLTVEPDERCLCAVEDGVTVAVMTHVLLRPDHYYVVLSYVRPSHRRRGIYSALWRALLARARASGVRSIESMTHEDNRVMRDIAARLGRKPSWRRGALIDLVVNVDCPGEGDDGCQGAKAEPVGPQA